MKRILFFLLAIASLTSCDKNDIAAELKDPHPLQIEEMVSFIGKSYDSISTNLENTSVLLSGSRGNREAMFLVLDKESPNPNFICKIIEKEGLVSKIVISTVTGSYGTFKNTFYYFDNLLSEKYPLSKFYVIDADGGINLRNKTKEELYTYLRYNTSSGAALEFKTTTTKILNFCFQESDKAFALTIEEK